jgi:glucose/arabinose dehydrogenase
VLQALFLASAAALTGAGCSGSSAELEPGTSETSSASTPASTTEPTSTVSPPASTTTVPGETRIPRGTEKITALRSPPPAERLPAFRAVRIAGANYPAGLAAAPDGRIFYSELWGGEIRVIRRDGRVEPQPWADVNGKFGIRWEQFYHGGLSGIAFDPEFERNRFVYVVTQVPSKKTGFAVRSLVVRYKDVRGRGRAPRVLLRLPASKFDNTYSLVFGPDGMLYVPTGFLGSKRPRGADPLADLRGKILRVTPAGRAPGDNPYGDRAPRVWAMGFKNVFDLAFFPRSRFALGGENGTVGHDEINLLMPGHNYGYPRYEGVTRRARLTPPLLDYGSDSPAPVGVIYYTGRRHPALRGRFLMCTNDGGMVALRIKRRRPGRLLNLTPIVEACTLDLVQTPDGAVVFSDAGAIYRLVP